MKSQKSASSATASMMFRDHTDTALKRIPPLWPLSRFVAVNPFSGLSDMSFEEASSLLSKTIGTSLTMPPYFYRERYHSGVITKEDLKKALHESALAGDDSQPSECELIADLIEALENHSWKKERISLLSLPSSLLDAAQGSRWNSFVCEEISKWCTAYFDLGQALWSFPWKGMPLFGAWKEAASLDCNPEISGIAGWRNLVRELPNDPDEVVEEAAFKLGIPADKASETFYGLLLGIGGWAGHLQFLAHEKMLRGEKGDSLIDLLAIRMVYELALQSAFPQETLLLSQTPAPSGMDTTLASEELIWQRAHECAMQRGLFAKLSSPPLWIEKTLLKLRRISPPFRQFSASMFGLKSSGAHWKKLLLKVRPWDLQGFLASRSR